MKKAIQLGLGFAIGGVLLWLMFRGTDWAVVGQAIRNMHLGWLLLAQIPVYVSFFLRVQRWTYIVRAVAPATYRDMFSATQIGFLANFTLPGRVGEAIRAVVLSKKSGIPFSKSFALVALDRVTDLVGLIAVLAVAVLSVTGQEGATIPAETFGTPQAIVFSASSINAGAIGTSLFLFLVASFMVVMYVRVGIALSISDAFLGIFSSKLAAKAHDMIVNFSEGLHIFRSPLEMSKALFFSMLTWASFIIAAMMFYKSFGYSAPWYTAFVMQSLLAIAISVPGAPGFVGQFHIPIVITMVMMVPGTDPNQAKALAIVIHLVNMFAVMLLGFYCMFREQMGLMELGRDSAATETESENA